MKKKPTKRENPKKPSADEILDFIKKWKVPEDPDGDVASKLRKHLSAAEAAEGKPTRGFYHNYTEKESGITKNPIGKKTSFSDRSKEEKSSKKER